jgi:hypothetical protein
MKFKTAIVIAFVASLIGCGGGDIDNNSSETQSRSLRSLATATAVNEPAKFAGNRNDYAVTKNADGTYSVKDNRTNGAAVLIAAGGTLAFADVNVNLGIENKAASILTADLNLLIELYLAFFNRVPDADGLEYWIEQLQNGTTIEQVAESFYAAGVQNAAVTGYSANMTDSDFVRLIYKNVLGRTTVDQESLNYWTASLAGGSKTRGTLVKTILASAHTFKGDATYGWVADLLDNKITVALNFSVKQGLNFKSTTDAINKGMEIAAAVTPTDISTATQKINALLLPTNSPAIANAGVDKTVFVSSVVNVNGAASSDPNNDPLFYRWNIDSAPIGSTAQLSSSTAVAPTFKADVAGDYVLSLIVTDGKVSSAPDRVTITAVRMEPTVIADTGIYKCSTLSKTQALSLYAAGHTYLDRDHDGKPCEANDLVQELISTASTASTASSTSSVSSTASGRCWVNGYYRKNGTYVKGYYRSC